MKMPGALARVASAIRMKWGPVYSAVPRYAGWFGVIRESFSGAFQSAIEVDSPKDMLAFSAVFSCISLISSDIAKLDLDLMQEDANGVEVKVNPTSPYWMALRKPNHFQNRIQFVEQWIVSKLLYGNTYVLKERDARGIVRALYILDAQLVTPLVARSGEVFYQLGADHLSGLEGQTTVPASEIIHDRMCCLWHPLVGISPLYAAGMSATMGNRIQTNSTKFFDNMSRPSGILSAPGEVSDEDATRLKNEWENNFGRANMGRVAVLGSDLKYQAMTMTPEAAQLISQLEWAVKDVARCFHVPLFKIGESGGEVSGMSVQQQQQRYLDDCLHGLIEAMEECLTDGLEVAGLGYCVELDEDDLLRMDKLTQYDAYDKAIKGGWMHPNYPRKKHGMQPVNGGDTPYLQQQNYSLDALARRDAKADPFGTASKMPEPASVPNSEPSKGADFDIAEWVKSVGEITIAEDECLTA